MIYKQSIIEAMGWLAEQSDTIFLGQTVACPGSYMYGSLEKVPMSKRIEFPVAENLQLGASFGMALSGLCVISIFPRIDFLLLALDQLVNHIDKIGPMSRYRMNPRIIIRTSIGPREPLDGGVQHTQDHGLALHQMLTAIDVIRVRSADLALLQYKGAYSQKHRKITLFIEEGSLY